MPRGRDKAALNDAYDVIAAGSLVAIRVHKLCLLMASTSLVQGTAARLDIGTPIGRPRRFIGTHLGRSCEGNLGCSVGAQQSNLGTDGRHSPRAERAWGHRTT